MSMKRGQLLNNDENNNSNNNGRQSKLCRYNFLIFHF